MRPRPSQVSVGRIALGAAACVAGIALAVACGGNTTVVGKTTGQGSGSGGQTAAAPAPGSEPVTSSNEPSTGQYEPPGAGQAESPGSGAPGEEPPGSAGPNDQASGSTPSGPCLPCSGTYTCTATGALHGTGNIVLQEDGTGNCVAYSSSW